MSCMIHSHEILCHQRLPIWKLLMIKATGLEHIEGPGRSCLNHYVQLDLAIPSSLYCVYTRPSLYKNVYNKNVLIIAFEVENVASQGRSKLHVWNGSFNSSL